MAHPKLFTLIDAIDLKQINALRRYTLSKVSEQSEAYQIMEMIIKTKDKREKYGDADSLQKAYFPSIKTKNFVNYLSLLYSYAEDWIALSQMEEDEYSKDLLVQRWLNNHGLYSLSDQVVKKVLKKIDETKHLDLIEPKVKAELLYEHYISNNPIKYEFQFEQYFEMIFALEEYYCSQQFILITELQNWCDVNNKVINKDIKEVLDKFMNYNKTELSIVAKATYQLYSENNYGCLLKILEKLQSGNIKTNSKFNYIITNFIIKKLIYFRSVGKPIDVNLIYKITVYGLNTGVFLVNGKISVNNFHNIISRHAHILSFEELNAFINKWIHKVEGNNIEATYNLALAQSNFYNHKYSNLLKLVWRSDFENLNQKILAQALYLIASFVNRKEDYDFYKKAIISSVNILNRNRDKLSLHIYNSHLNLIDFFKQIDSIGHEKVEISSYKYLLFKDWCQYILKIRG